MHLEVGIAKGFFCTWPLLWVPPQHILHQADRLLARLSSRLSQNIPHLSQEVSEYWQPVVWWRQVELPRIVETWNSLTPPICDLKSDWINFWPWTGYLKGLQREKGQTFRPVPLVRGAQDRADLEDLVDLGVSGEERAEGVELRHDATHRPDVDWSRIESAANTNISIEFINYIHILLWAQVYTIKPNISCTCIFCCMFSFIMCLYLDYLKNLNTCRRVIYNQ